MTKKGAANSCDFRLKKGIKESIEIINSKVTISLFNSLKVTYFFPKVSVRKQTLKKSVHVHV